jgi:hypothetical protein
MLSIAALQYCTRSAKKLYSGKKNFFWRCRICQQIKKPSRPASEFSIL